MFKRNILTSLLLGFALCSFSMTDQQVIEFIKQQSALGKSEQEIGKALLARGVTPAQAKRIKEQFVDKEEELPEKSTSTVRTPQLSQGNLHRQRNNEMTPNDIPQGYYFNENGELVLMEEIQEEPSSDRQIYGHQVFNSRGLSFEPSENLATPQNYILGPGDEVIIDIWGSNEDHIQQVISPEGNIMIYQIGPVYLNGKNINQANNYIKNIFAQKYS